MIHFRDLLQCNDEKTSENMTYVSVEQYNLLFLHEILHNRLPLVVRGAWHVLRIIVQEVEFQALHVAQNCRLFFFNIV